MTSLHHAVEEDSEAVVAVLIEYGADPTLGNNIIGMDNTPLHAAISKGQTRIAKLLLETGQFDVNKPGASMSVLLSDVLKLEGGEVGKISKRVAPVSYEPAQGCG